MTANWTNGRAAMPAILCIVLVTQALTASAQNAKAEAEQLFREGRRLMKEGKYAEACQAFEASQQRDPDVATLMNLGDCREKNSQIASAWAAFLEAERASRGVKGQEARTKTAKERAAKLEARLSFLTVSVPDESRVAGLELTRNGEPLDEALWNRAIPVDGGSYVIGGRAPGHEQWATTVNVPNENGRVGVDVPKFKDVDTLVSRPKPQPKPEADPDDEEDEPIVFPEEPSAFTGRRKVALGVAGIGVVALGLGTALGLQVKSLENDARTLCPANPCAGADEANAVADRARSRALFANVSLGVAVGAVAGAAFLWFTGGPDAREQRTAVSPIITPSYAGIDVAVRF